MSVQGALQVCSQCVQVSAELCACSPAAPGVQDVLCSVCTSAGSVHDTCVCKGWCCTPFLLPGPPCPQWCPCAAPGPSDVVRAGAGGGDGGTQVAPRSSRRLSPCCVTISSAVPVSPWYPCVPANVPVSPLISTYPPVPMSPCPIDVSLSPHPHVPIPTNVSISPYPCPFIPANVPVSAYPSVPMSPSLSPLLSTCPHGWPHAGVLSPQPPPHHVPETPCPHLTPLSALCQCGGDAAVPWVVRRCHLTASRRAGTCCSMA